MNKIELCKVKNVNLFYKKRSISLAASLGD